MEELFEKAFSKQANDMKSMIIEEFSHEVSQEANHLSTLPPSSMTVEAQCEIYFGGIPLTFPPDRMDQDEESKQKQAKTNDYRSYSYELSLIANPDQRPWFENPRVEYVLEVVKRERVSKEIKVPLRWCLNQRLVMHTITCLILANALVTALDADSQIRRSIKGYQTALSLQLDDVVMEPAPEWFLVADWIFASVFTVELSCRLLVEEMQFFCGDDLAWNLIDLLVVVTSWADILNKQNIDVPMRILRLLKVIRSVRVIRGLRYFSGLRFVMLSLVHAVKPLLWCSSVLLLIMFVFANLFVQLVASKFQQYEFGMQATKTWPQDLLADFSTFNDTLISLFRVVSGGLDWGAPYKAFSEASPTAGVCFLVYIVVVFLGVLNVIAAVFVEGALSKAKSDTVYNLMQEEENRKAMAQELLRIFKHIDSDRSGHVSMQRWVDFLETREGREFLILFNVDISNAIKLFQLLDQDDGGTMEQSEFVMGFLQVCGGVSKIDSVLPGEAINKLSNKLDKSVDEMTQNWLKVYASVQELAGHLANIQTVRNPSRMFLRSNT